MVSGDPRVHGNGAADRGGNTGKRLESAEPRLRAVRKQRAAGDARARIQRFAVAKQGAQTKKAYRNAFKVPVARQYIAART